MSLLRCLGVESFLLFFSWGAETPLLSLVLPRLRGQNALPYGLGSSTWRDHESPIPPTVNHHRCNVGTLPSRYLYAVQHKYVLL